MQPMRETASDAPPAEAVDQIALVHRLTPVARNVTAAWLLRLPMSVLRDDVFAAAMVGVWQTVLRHGATADPDELIGQATVRINGSIIDELRRADWLPRRARADRDAGRPTPVTAVLLFADVGEHELEESFAVDEPGTDARETAEQIAEAVRTLPEREGWIVALHYRGEVRFREIGRLFGVTEARISQLHARAIRQLQAALTGSSDAPVGAAARAAG